MESTLIARHACLMILADFYKSQKPIDFFERQHFEPLDQRDRTLARAILTTLMRHHGDVDFLIEAFMKKPFNHTSLERHLMRIGITQLLFVDAVPAHAAIHGTVELAKKLGRSKASTVINAILRRTQREGLSLLGQHKGEHLNVPAWLQERLSEYYNPTRRDDILKQMTRPTRVDIRVRNAAVTQALAEYAYPVPIHPETYRIKDKTTKAQDLPGWDAGHLYIQDAITQVPARLLAHFISESGPILDMCAAPGGKTIQLCDLVPTRQIIAADFNFGRLRRLRQNMTRCQVNPHIICADGTQLPLADDSMAAVLVDTPCSATGTTRRHPDILKTRSEADVTQLLEIQQALLTEAARVVKPGGIIVYSTCSLLLSESEHQISAFLKKHQHFSQVTITSDLVGNADIITSKGELRATPAEKLDGFFAAVIRQEQAP